MTATSSPPTSARWSGRGFRAIVSYTLRSCIGPGRWLGCLIPCAGALLFGLMSHALGQPAGEAFARVAATGILGLVLPITSLVIGDAVLGAEIRSGVFHFTWLTPAPLGQIVVGRWIGGALVALLTVVPATVLAALVAGAPPGAAPAAIAAACGSLAYLALFIAIGCVARRAAVWSLAFVFLVERLLGTVLSGIAQWSPMWESRAVFVELSGDAPASLVRGGIPGGGAAIVRLGIIAAAALVVARWRLGHLRLSGSSD